MKWIKTDDGRISGFFRGRPFQIQPDYYQHEEIMEALRNDDADRFEELLISEEKLQDFCQGVVSFEGETAVWNGVPLPALLTNRIIGLSKSGSEFEPMVNFAINLCNNPADHSIKDLINFLQHRNMPLTPDGCFLAYKAVKHNYKDIYSGTIDNSVGESPSVPRKSVDANSDRHCSHGLHVGALSYASQYGGIDLDNLNREAKDHRLIIVKVNPANVVTVPKDSSFQKLRCCEYTVIQDYEGKLHDQIEDTDELDIPSRPEGWLEKITNRFKGVFGG